MSKKIIVKVCTGTACYIMGGSQLVMLGDELPESLKDSVEIEGMLCLDYCKDSSKGKVPFVSVNETIISEATVPKVINYIKSIVDAK